MKKSQFIKYVSNFVHMSTSKAYIKWNSFINNSLYSCIVTVIITKWYMPVAILYPVANFNFFFIGEGEV